MYDNGIYDINRLPLGLMGFSNIINNNMIYVDKTSLIAKIASKKTPVFFSRPRRFGKSLLINTLHALFERGLDDFSGLDIKDKWNDRTYKVVHLDFSSIANKNHQELKAALGDRIIEEFCLRGTINQYENQILRTPDSILNEIAKKFNDNSIVLLIDEYDAPLTHHINDSNELNKITSVLNDFYATIKQYTDKFRFIFITGVTRISHVSIFSAFNNLNDLSLNEEYNSLLGFTQNDLERYFDPFVERAAYILNINKNEVYKKIKYYYDGFQFAINAEETVYNPWSILSFFYNQKNGFKNYWFQSGGITSLIVQYLKISNSFDFLNYKDRNISLSEDELADRYEIDKIPHHLLLYQAGYFTIRNKNTIINLILPNVEVEESLLRLYLTANNLSPQEELIEKMHKLSQDIDSKNLQAIVKIFNEILNECISSSSSIFDDERSIRDIIYAALIKIPQLQKIKERETIKGKSDLELITNKTCMIIEFKRTYLGRGPKASLNKAIEQIKNNRYGLLFSQSKIPYRVAMVISTEEKRILYEFCKEVI